MRHGPKPTWSHCAPVFVRSPAREQSPVLPLKTMIYIAALRYDQIDAPWIIAGLVNSAIFLRYVGTELIPTLGCGFRLKPATVSEGKSASRPHRHPSAWRPVALPIRLQTSTRDSTPQPAAQAVGPGLLRRTSTLRPQLHSFCRAEPLAGSADRTALRQTQAPAAQSVCPDRRGNLEADRPPPWRVHRQGMRKRPPELRLWFNLTPSRFSTTLADFDRRSWRGASYSAGTVEGAVGRRDREWLA